MTTATSKHYENASFLRELAETLTRINPNPKPEQTQLLQRLADEELEQARYNEWVSEKIAVSRADTRPGMTTAQLRQKLADRYQELHEFL